MTSSVIKVPLSLLDSSITLHTETTLSLDTLYYNGFAIKCKLCVAVNLNEIKFTVYFRPETNLVYNTIDLKAEYGFLNSNGNLCRKKTFKHHYEHKNTNMFGLVFYTVNSNDFYKLKQCYTVGNHEIHVKVIISKCSSEACLEQLLRVLYLKHDGLDLDRILKQLDEAQNKYLECEARNYEMSQLLDSILEKPKKTISHEQPVAKIEREASSLDDILSRLSLEELTVVSKKINERIEDIRRCKICLSSCSVIMLLPCRHTCMCSDCSEKHKKSDNKCPVCRSIIHDRIKIFI